MTRWTHSAGSGAVADERVDVPVDTAQNRGEGIVGHGGESIAVWGGAVSRAPGGVKTGSAVRPRKR